MPSVDPFISLRDWRTSLYRGTPAVVDRFLDTVDATLPADWTRDHAYEQTRPRRDRVRCYLFDRQGDAAVRLWLERVTTTRGRGGPTEVLRHPPSGDAVRIARLVAEFTDDCVLAAANAAGIRCTRPSFGPRTAINSAAVTLLNQFADTADGQWPLPERLRESWDDLVSGCLAEQVAINRGDLEKWLADSGWEPEAVAQIADQFFADSRRLAKLAERFAATAP
ncbi:MAG TPA: hypothetical protein VNH11_31630 [Pirellulales bacterium]|nr:hypothetical protein [Pirellulales bacterium]